MSLIEIEEITRKLTESVSDYRFEHALLVAETAAEIARRFGVDGHKARLAGLLHDCAKGFTDDPEPILLLSEQAGLAPNQTQLADPVLFLHAPLSAYVAQRDYGIEDREILDAIARHQSGHISMTKLDKIIYIADWTEPTRKGMDVYRELLTGDLDEAFFRLYADNIIRVVQRGWMFFENISDVYNNLLLERMKKAGKAEACDDA